MGKIKCSLMIKWAVEQNKRCLQQYVVEAWMLFMGSGGGDCPLFFSHFNESSGLDDLTMVLKI